MLSTEKFGIGQSPSSKRGGASGGVWRYRQSQQANRDEKKVK